MSGIERLLVASLVLALGLALGYLIRRRLRSAGPVGDQSFGLTTGLVVVTAPYCTRCASLCTRLDDAGITYTTVNAADQPSLLTDLGVSAAPTLLQVDESGDIGDREHRNFSDARLGALASARDSTTDRKPR